MILFMLNVRESYPSTEIGRAGQISSFFCVLAVQRSCRLRCRGNSKTRFRHLTRVQVYSNPHVRLVKHVRVIHIYIEYVRKCHRGVCRLLLDLRHNSRQLFCGYNLSQPRVDSGALAYFILIHHLHLCALPSTPHTPNFSSPYIWRLTPNIIP